MRHPEPAREPRSLEEFWALFPSNGLGPPPGWRAVDAERLPASCRDLLVRSRHMTLALKEHHDSELTLRVLQSRLSGNFYSRQSLLIAARSGAPVLLGIIHLDLEAFSPKVQEAILAEDDLLGNILIREQVPRRIEPFFFLEVDPTEELRRALAHCGEGPIHGRSAAIHCGERATIDLLELVPEAPTGTQES
jgi:hypothetical protein